MRKNDRGDRDSSFLIGRFLFKGNLPIGEKSLDLFSLRTSRNTKHGKQDRLLSTASTNTHSAPTGATQHNIKTHFHKLTHHYEHAHNATTKRVEYVFTAEQATLYIIHETKPAKIQRKQRTKHRRRASMAERSNST